MKINQRKAGAALSYISMGLGYLVSILYTPIMLRLLGQSEYGLYNLVISVIAYLGLLNFGFGSTYMRYYSRYKVQDDGGEKVATLNGMFLIIFSTLGLLAVIAGSILAANIEAIFGAKLTAVELDRAKILMLILVVNLGISFPGYVFIAHITANEKFVFLKLIRMIQTIAHPFVVLPMLMLGYGSVGMVVITTILNVMIEVIFPVYCLRNLEMRFSFRNFDFRFMREMTVFSSFIFINIISDQINWNIDKFLIGRYKGTSEVAIYSLGAQLNTYVVNISTTISSVFIPHVHRLVAQTKSNTEVTEFFVRIGRVQYIIISLIISGYLVFGKSFIRLWAGNAYSDSFYITAILLFPMIIVLSQNIGIEIRKAKNLHKAPALVMALTSIINLVLSISLIKKFGAIGGAIGTSFAIAINQIFINHYYHNVVGINIVKFFKEIGLLSKGLLIPIATAIVLILSRNHFSDIWFLALSVPYMILFAVSVYFLGLNQYEKTLFFPERLRRIFRKKGVLFSRR